LRIETQRTLKVIEKTKRRGRRDAEDRREGLFRSEVQESVHRVLKLVERANLVTNNL
jgi:hypothetical protein